MKNIMKAALISPFVHYQFTLVLLSIFLGAGGVVVYTTQFGVSFLKFEQYQTSWYIIYSMVIAYLTTAMLLSWHRMHIFNRGYGFKLFRAWKEVLTYELYLLVISFMAGILILLLIGPFILLANIFSIKDIVSNLDFFQTVQIGTWLKYIIFSIIVFCFLRIFLVLPGIVVHSKEKKWPAKFNKDFSFFSENSYILWLTIMVSYLPLMVLEFFLTDSIRNPLENWISLAMYVIFCISAAYSLLVFTAALSLVYRENILPYLEEVEARP